MGSSLYPPLRTKRLKITVVCGEIEFALINLCSTSLDIGFCDLKW